MINAIRTAGGPKIQIGFKTLALQAKSAGEQSWRNREENRALPGLFPARNSSTNTIHSCYFRRSPLGNLEGGQLDTLQDLVEGRSVRFERACRGDKNERQYGVALADRHQMVRFPLPLNLGIVLQ